MAQILYNNISLTMNHLEQDKSLISLIVKYKTKGMLKVWKKRSKNSKQRYFKLKEWSDTQKAYRDKLNVLQQKVKKPLRANNLIQQYEETIIFSNLESMIKLSLQMQQKIGKLLENWDPHTTVLAPTVESLSIYLKIYKEYSNNYKKADGIIQQLKKGPRWKEVIQIFNVEDFLIKPVQRPLQYKLFVTDYLKLLPANHIDKQNLQKALKVLLKIADQINDYVEKQIRAEKMIYLENTFGNLIESTRQYRSQLDAFHPEFNCRIYVFNDLLLFVKLWSEDKQQKFMYMYLCGGSYVIRQPDNKTFKNRLYICGSFQSVHLTFRDPEDANNAYNIINGLINVLYQKEYNRAELISQMKMKRQTMMIMNRHSMGNQYKWKEQYQYRMKLRVQVIGVEKRLYEKQWKIVYAVKFQLGHPQNFYYIVYYELDQLKQLERYIKEVYQRVNIPSLDNRLRGMNYDDFKTDFTKYFEYKAILIQDFLNFCLRNKQICKKPEFIAFKLKIPQSLWDYLNKFSTICGCIACLNAEVIVTMQAYKKLQYRMRKMELQFCILNAFQYQNMLPETIKLPDFKKLSLEERLIWANCKQKRIDYGFQSKGQFGKKICFHVYMKLIGQQSQIFIQKSTINDTCRQIVQEVCNKKGITQSQDFFLVYVHGKHEYYLDNDQYIYDAIKHLEEDYKKIQNDKRVSLTTRASIFNNFSKSMDNYGDLFNDFSVLDQPKLYVRKVITLNKQLEEKACHKNPQRYPVILGELLRKFQQQYLLLSLEEIKIFCALFYGVEEFNTIIFSKNVFCNEEKLKKYLPQSKWNFVSLQFTERVRQILESQVKGCTSILLVYRAILAQFNDKLGSITHYIQVQNLSPELLGVKQKYLLIGVNHSKVVVSRKFNSVSLIEYPLNKFEYRTSGDMLFIDNQEKQYKFVGNNWLFFENLLQKYRLIQQMELSQFS